MKNDRRRILRHPEKLHDTIKEGMFEGKIPPERSCNTFIGKVKRDAASWRL